MTPWSGGRFGRIAWGGHLLSVGEHMALGWLVPSSPFGGGGPQDFECPFPATAARNVKPDVDETKPCPPTCRHAIEHPVRSVNPVGGVPFDVREPGRDCQCPWPY